MKIKNWLKILALAAGLFTPPVYAAKTSNLEVFPSSAAYHIGYANGAGSLRPALGISSVFVSSGAAVVQSTSTDSGHKPFRVLNASGSEILSVTQGGVVAGATISGNATSATALAANGANCSAGNYPLGVDASGAAESCTPAGVGDAVLASTQTWSGANTFSSTNSFNGALSIAGPTTFYSTVKVGAPAVYTSTLNYSGAVAGVWSIVAVASITAVDRFRFTNFNSSYTHRVTLNVVQNASNADLIGRFADDTGSNYRYAYYGESANVGAEAAASNSATSIVMTGTDILASSPVTALIQVNCSSGGQQRCSMISRVNYDNIGGALNSSESDIACGGHHNNTGAITNFSIWTTAGTLTGTAIVEVLTPVIGP